jgi:Mg/Co/Ni transporter MgtE
MDISNVVTTEYRGFSTDTPISKLVGAFEDASCKGVVVQRDGDFEGIVTRRQLATSHHPPDEKAGSLVWHVPRLAPTEDVREVAQLMIDSDCEVLPVFEGDDLVGVVTADDLLRVVVDRSPFVFYRFRVRPEARFEFVSETVRDVYGYSPEEFYQNPEILARRIPVDDRINRPTR